MRGGRIAAARRAAQTARDTASLHGESGLKPGGGRGGRAGWRATGKRRAPFPSLPPSPHLPWSSGWGRRRSSSRLRRSGKADSAGWSASPPRAGGSKMELSSPWASGQPAAGGSSPVGLRGWLEAFPGRAASFPVSSFPATGSFPESRADSPVMLGTRVGARGNSAFPRATGGI